MVARRRPTGQDILQAKRDLVDSMDLILGFDVAKDWHYVQMLEGRGYRPIGHSIRVENNRAGYNHLANVVHEALSHIPLDRPPRVIVGMESTGVYWKPLAYFCREQGWTVVLVNPYHVKLTKEVQDNTQTKSDSKDALLVAELVRDGKFLTARLPEGVYHELRTLTDLYDQQRQDHSRIINRLKTVLNQYFPEFTTVFRGLEGKGALWVLENIPLPTDVLKYNREELAQAIGSTGQQKRLEHKRAQRLWEAAQESIGIRGAGDAVREEIRARVRELRYVNGEIGRTEKLMEEALGRTGETADRLLSISGIARRIAARVLGLLGDPAGYNDPRQMARMAGLNLVHESSGQKNGRRHISKRGSARLRGALYQATLAVIRHDAGMAEWYQRLTTRPQNPLSKKAALVAAMVKLLRIIHALEKRQECYQPGMVGRTKRLPAA